MTAQADINFETFCVLRDFSDEQLKAIEKAARMAVRFKRREKGYKDLPTASSLLAAWEDDPRALMQLHSAVIIRAKEMGK